MRLAKKFFLALISGCLLGISFSIIQANAVSNEEPNQISIPQEELGLITEVLQQVRDHYVDEVDERELLIGAIRGMLNELDPHSTYLDPKELERLTTDAAGKFGGLGISVVMDDGIVKVVAPIDDTPAKRAGILSGDLIIRLDETEVRGMTLEQAVDKMRGDPGTSIALTIIREGASKPLIIKIIREIIEVPSIKKRMLEAGFGYVRIVRFQEETDSQFKEAVEDLTEKNGQDLRGLVLDLRANPGGLLSSAVGVSDLLLDEGLIVFTQGRANFQGVAQRKESKAFPGDILRGIPVVVLVNEGSASASEIVAAALQDNKRALIIGRPTFGKATVQQPITLKNGGALKLTIARYYSPSGRSIQLNGITPDVIIRRVNLTEETENFTLTESNLTGRLDNPDEKDGDKKSKDSKSGDDKDATVDEEEFSKPLVEEDFELYEALNILKGLSIFSASNKK
ncbi:MAG: S41 family peptidase [Gammaproteobacteria bacterium]|nr:S41 family peptidase [Pseudomonadota bacterium]MCH9662549.1 S41 family peptidase [Gammaproteobacteria bacterium]